MLAQVEESDVTPAGGQITHIPHTYTSEGRDCRNRAHDRLAGLSVCMSVMCPCTRSCFCSFASDPTQAPAPTAAPASDPHADPAPSPAPTPTLAPVPDHILPPLTSLAPDLSIALVPAPAPIPAPAPDSATFYTSAPAPA